MTKKTQLEKRGRRAAYVTDVVAFELLLCVFREQAMLYRILVSTVMARLIAECVYNAAKGQKRVEHAKQRFVMWLFYMSASCGNACLWGFVNMGLVFWLKPTGDLIIGLAGDAVFFRWTHGEKAFWGRYPYFGRILSPVFFGRYRVDAPETEEAVVYVCRHGNMHGPVITLMNYPEELHPMVLGCYLNYHDCVEQLTERTYTKRFGMKRWLAKPLAVISSWIIVPFMRSVQAVPTYHDNRALSTLRQACRYLLKGESVIVFPDIDYTASEGDSGIYRGFVTLGAMYRKKTGKELKFIPLLIDDEEKQIIVRSGITCGDGGSARDRVADYLQHEIHLSVSEA